MVVKYEETDKNTKSTRIIDRWFTDDAYRCYAILEAFDKKKGKEE